MNSSDGENTVKSIGKCALTIYYTFLYLCPTDHLTPWNLYAPCYGQWRFSISSIEPFEINKCVTFLFNPVSYSNFKSWNIREYIFFISLSWDYKITNVEREEHKRTKVFFVD